MASAAGGGGEGVLPLPLPPSQQNQHPSYFMKGSIIKLPNGKVKRIEDLRTEDFVQSAQVSGDHRLYSLTVIKFEEFTDREEANLDFSIANYEVSVDVS